MRMEEEEKWGEERELEKACAGGGKEKRTTRRKLPTGFALSISHRVLAPNALEGGWRDGVGRCAVYGEEAEEKMGEETAAE